MFHKRGDIDTLYFKRSEGGRGLISVRDCVLIEKNSLYKSAIESDEPMLKAVAKEEIIDHGKKSEKLSRREQTTLIVKIYIVFSSRKLNSEINRHGIG